MNNSVPDKDCNHEVIAAIQSAQAAGTALYISAGNSKRHLLGRDCAAPALDISAHRGVIDYQPQELVLTARAGTPVEELQALLAQERQMLAFEPPGFAGRATLGGTLACNLSGPARPWHGSIRDSVLGVKLINGKGELLNFGGQVMKNVAGYDVARLQAGALGTLGVISEISLKVLPRHEHTLTLRYTLGAQAALEQMQHRAAEAKPLTGACWFDGQLFLRLSGAASAVEHTARAWGGEELPEANTPWRDLGAMTLPFFDGDTPLWRLSHKPTAPLAPGSDQQLIDWGGALRWVRAPADAHALHTLAQSAGGHACLFRGGDRSGELRAPVAPALQRLQRNLKMAFDPGAVLNPGRLYSWL